MLRREYDDDGWTDLLVVDNVVGRHLYEGRDARKEDLGSAALSAAGFRDRDCARGDRAAHLEDRVSLVVHVRKRRTRRRVDVLDVSRGLEIDQRTSKEGIESASSNDACRRAKAELSPTSDRGRTVMSLQEDTA